MRLLKWREGAEGGGANRSKAPLARRFTYRYALAIVLFGAVALLAWTSTNSALHRIDETNRELVAVTEQAARIQSIAALAVDMTEDADAGIAVESSTKTEFRELVNELAETQRALLKGSEKLGLPGNPSGELAALWETDRLDQEIALFADLADDLSGFMEVGDLQKVARQDVLEQLIPAADPSESKIVPGLTKAIELYSTQLDDAVKAQEDTNLLLLFAFGLTAAVLVLVVFRPMAQSIHTETSNLENAERIQRENSERQTFRNQLSQALEVTDSEEEVLSAVGRAMVEVIGEHPSELLLADATTAHLRQSVVSPTMGSPDCPVDSPFGCAAIRRGQTVVYETSRALNVCPKLTQHEGGACSAVCSPVTFMGEALGVLHTTGPDLHPPTPVDIERLNVMASEVGSRLGTLRATQQTKMQASTDGLTGLPNRRSLEQAARELISMGRPFAVAMADLDHFKDLNDTYGHEAGDRALKLFAKTLRSNLRPDDVAARYGGEEFVLVLPNASVEEAKRALDRLRVTLAGDIAASGGVPFTASWGLTTSNAGQTLDEMIVAADEALYAAKRAGRNRIIVGGTPDAIAAEGEEGEEIEYIEEVVIEEVYEEDALGTADVLDETGDTCPGCGSQNPEGSKFCLDCGTPLLTGEDDGIGELDIELVDDDR